MPSLRATREEDNMPAYGVVLTPERVSVFPESILSSPPPLQAKVNKLKTPNYCKRRKP